MSKLERFDGAAAWEALAPDVQIAIGSIALEYGAALAGSAARSEHEMDWNDEDPLDRALDAAMVHLATELQSAVETAVPDLIPEDNIQVRIPSRLGDVCRKCGCSDNDACDAGCSWAEPDLCTACA